MLLAKDCVTSIENIADTSSAYVQMTGLLAGFAFTALVMLLTPTQVEHRQPRDQPQAGQLFMALFAAFVAFLFSSLAYSVLAGESVADAPGRASTEELVDGLPFGLAFVMLFHGLALLLKAGNAYLTAVRTVHVVAVLVLPVMAMLYLSSAVPDLESARAKGGCTDPATYNLSLLLTLLTLAVLVATLVARRKWRPFREWTMRNQSAAPIIVLVICVLATGWAGDLATRGPGFLISQTWLVVYLEVTWLLLTGVGVILIASWPDPAASAPVRLAPPQWTQPDALAGVRFVAPEQRTVQAAARTRGAVARHAVTPRHGNFRQLGPRGPVGPS